MGLYNRALEILIQQGPVQLFKSGSKYLSDLVIYQSRSRIYSLKARIYGDYKVSIGQIVIDLESDAISEDMRQKIRTGEYEVAESDFVKSYLRSDTPVLELGSGIGYVTCLVDRYTDDDIPVVGVEANSNLIPVIERTRELNDANFEIINSAYSSMNDSVEFRISNHFWESSREEYADGDKPPVTVEGASLDRLLAETSLSSPFQLIADIEGSEDDLLRNEAELLAEHCILLMVEFHSSMDQSRFFYDTELRQLGFRCIDSNGAVYIYLNETIST